MSGYRTPVAFAGRCGRGHMHTLEGVGGYCMIATCRGIAEGGSWDPARRIERVEVPAGTVWPNAQYEFVLDHLTVALKRMSWPELAKIASAARKHANISCQTLMRRMRGVVVTEAQIGRMETGQVFIDDTYVEAVLHACNLPKNWSPE